MCIAIIKPKGYAIPTKEMLKRCWDNNPNGGGFAFNNGESVEIHKGFMKFKEFYKFLINTSKKHDLVNNDLVLHFRIATSGGVNPECTHPFPISHNLNDLKLKSCKCDKAFVHNGIISGYGGKDYSDTMHYIINVISNIHDLANSEILLDSLACEHGSRFMVLFKDGFIKGGKWVEDNGIWYSNETYKAEKTTTYCSKWDAWDDWEELYTEEKGMFTCRACGQKDLWKNAHWDHQFGWVCKDCKEELAQYYNW